MKDNQKQILTPTVLIVSGGRTGTKFFGDCLAGMIEDCYSVHEPDVIAGLEYPIIERIRTFGIYHMIVGRLLGKTGIRNLSLRYLAGRLDRSEAAAAIYRHRASYYASLNKPLVLEAYTGWFGLLPVLPEVFPRLRLIVVYRDPRCWVRSIMNWGTLYGRRDWVGKLGLGRLHPKIVNDREACARWSSMSRFERVCWAWSTINQLLWEGSLLVPDSFSCRYEDVFLSNRSPALQRNMLEYMTNFGTLQFSYTYRESEFHNKVHQSQGGFPHWQDWTQEQVRVLCHYCEPLMKKLGYGQEENWLAMIGKA